MSLIGIISEEGLLTWDQIPVELLPPEIVQSMSKARPEGELHLTDLTICPINVTLRKRWDYYLPVENVYRMAKGKAIDNLCLDNRRPCAIYQPTLRACFNGNEVVGTPDVIDLVRGSIEDFKAPERMYSKVPTGYVYQLNGYAYLYSLCDPEVVVRSLMLNVCGHGRYLQMPVDLWPLENTRSFLIQRMDELGEVMLDDDPVCTDPQCYFCRGRIAYVR